VHQERVQTLNAALTALHAERLGTLDNVERQRVATLAALHAERLGTLDGVEQQRIATLAALHAERLAATADLRGERESVVDALEKEIQTLHTDGRDLINLLFLRGLELVLLTLFFCVLMAWILLRRFSRRPPERAERSLHRAA
jgi:DNA anti-recombination protein RmuC